MFEQKYLMQYTACQGFHSVRSCFIHYICLLVLRIMRKVANKFLMRKNLWGLLCGSKTI